MEVYIPWNNTWLDLPPLPDPGDGAGRMDQTRIMFMTGGGGMQLYLLGGTRYDWNTGTATVTGRVWRLVWESGSHTYSWTDSYVPALGRKLGSPLPTLDLLYYFTDTIFNPALAAGVPANFLDW